MPTISKEKLEQADFASFTQELQQNLPESAEREILLSITQALARGEHIFSSKQMLFLGADEEDLTPSAAASILKMSRTHLYKLLDAGIIPAKRVGRDRRISVKAVREYKEQLEANTRAQAESFAHRDSIRNALLGEMSSTRKQDK